MKIEEAKAGLERAGYVVTQSGDLFDVEGLARHLSEEELITLGHRHGVWPPAFERAHTAGPQPTRGRR